MKGTVMERFLAKINKTDTCWLWKGSKSSKGYGSININNAFMSAHRLSFMLFKGEIKNGLWVLHKCDTPACVNPEHLFLGNAKDNAIDMTNKNRGNVIFKNNHNKTHCKNGHEFTEENIYYYGSKTRPHRGCKICVKSRSVEAFKKRKMFVNNINKEYCNHGHKFDEINTRIFNGHRKCLQCNRERADKYYHQKKGLKNVIQKEI